TRSASLTSLTSFRRRRDRCRAMGARPGGSRLGEENLKKALRPLSTTGSPRGRLAAVVKLVERGRKALLVPVGGVLPGGVTVGVDHVASKGLASANVIANRAVGIDRLGGGLGVSAVMVPPQRRLALQPRPPACLGAVPPRA